MNIQEEIKEGLQLMGFYGVVIKIGIDNYSREVLVGRIVADSPCTIEVPLFEPLIKES